MKAFSNIHVANDEYWQKALEKYEMIKPLLNAEQQTSSCIKKYRTR